MVDEFFSKREVITQKNTTIMDSNGTCQWILLPYTYRGNVEILVYDDDDLILIHICNTFDDMYVDLLFVAVDVFPKVNSH